MRVETGPQGTSTTAYLRFPAAPDTVRPVWDDDGCNLIGSPDLVADCFTQMDTGL